MALSHQLHSHTLILAYQFSQTGFEDQHCEWVHQSFLMNGLSCFVSLVIFWFNSASHCGSACLRLTLAACTPAISQPVLLVSSKEEFTFSCSFLPVHLYLTDAQGGGRRRGGTRDGACRQQAVSIRGCLLSSQTLLPFSSHFLVCPWSDGVVKIKQPVMHVFTWIHTQRHTHAWQTLSHLLSPQ